MTHQFISFPKSGRSWLRFALGRLGFADRIFFHHDGFEYNDPAKPPLDFDFSERLRRYRGNGQIVYLRRDPRDVMVSLFHQVTGRFVDFFDFRGSISEFIRDPYFGAENLREFRSQWAALCAGGHAFEISYEACHDDFAKVLRSVLSQYGFHADEAALTSASQAAEFHNMKAVERANVFGESWLRLRNGTPKVRRGLIGGFVDELTADDIGYLDALFFSESIGRWQGE